MGIKDVFDRLKGKPDPRRDTSKDADAARRKTDEETIQVRVGDPSPNANSDSQQDPTVVAAPIHRPMPQARPAPEAERREADATVVIPPSDAPSAPQPTPPTPQAPSGAEQGQAEATVVAPPSSAPVPQRPVATPVAPRPASPQPAPQPAPQQQPQASPSTTPVAQKPAAAPAPTPAPATPKPVASGDETLYVSPDAETQNEIAGVLVGLFGEAKGQVFTVPEGQSTLGRADSCEIHVLDAKISREHAAISCVDGTVEVRALNERNPIIVNDGDGAETQSVADGDKIRFGNAGASIFRFRTIDGL
ncbi:MAG: FHA domain-containing protein [Deltaproteobacteria bacterium]|nr:FHA domain-containing protein [Deltaproteobacteria bacterium]